MIKTIIGSTTLMLGLLSIELNAQEFDSTAYKYASEITADGIKKHLEVIASDEYEGRETGQKGQKMTMEYLIEQFKSFGISDYKEMNYRQEFPLIEQENSGVNLKIGGKEFIMFEDFVLSPSFVKNQKIEGKIYLYQDKENEYAFIWKRDTASSSQASLKEQIGSLKESDTKIIFYYSENLSSNLEKYEHYFKRSRTKLASDLKENNQFMVSFSDAGLEKFLEASEIKRKKLDKKGAEVFSDLSMSFELDINKPNNELQGENVLAYIEGSEKKEELIIITAHYDHLGIEDSLVFNGADDDGSGTVSLIEIAESFMLAEKAGIKPKRSILIMPVSGEEKGLLGSKYYADNPVFPLENTVANLNIDMIGRYDENHIDDSNYVYLIGSDKLSTELHEVSEKVNTTYSNFNLDYRYNDENDPNRFYYRSDHYNFAKNNIPVIFYFSGVHEDYHRATDTIEKIDFEKTAKIARLVFHTAWELSNREERIQLDEKEDKDS